MAQRSAEAQDSVMGFRASARKLGQMRADRKGVAQGRDMAADLRDIEDSLIEAARLLRATLPGLVDETRERVRGAANNVARSVRLVQHLKETL